MAHQVCSTNFASLFQLEYYVVVELSSTQDDDAEDDLSPL